MATAALLAKVKTALRISHSKLDNELLDRVRAAQAEMIRVGVDPNKALEDNDPLICDAVKTYCQYAFTDDEKKREGFYSSFVCQVDGLRKSKEYRREE